MFWIGDGDNHGLLLDLLEKLRKNLNYTKKRVSVCVHVHFLHCSDSRDKLLTYLNIYIMLNWLWQDQYFTVLYFESS